MAGQNEARDFSLKNVPLRKNPSKRSARWLVVLLSVLIFLTLIGVVAVLVLNL